MAPFEAIPITPLWCLCSTSVETLWTKNVCIRLNKICIQYEKDIHKNIWLKFIRWNICFWQCINTLKPIFSILLKNPMQIKYAYPLRKGLNSIYCCNIMFIIELAIFLNWKFIRFICLNSLLDKRLINIKGSI